MRLGSSVGWRSDPDAVIIGAVLSPEHAHPMPIDDTNVIAMATGTRTATRRAPCGPYGRRERRLPRRRRRHPPPPHGDAPGSAYTPSPHTPTKNAASPPMQAETRDGASYGEVRSKYMRDPRSSCGMRASCRTPRGYAGQARNHHSTWEGASADAGDRTVAATGFTTPPRCSRRCGL
jgi:hypothetical protein